MGRVITVISNDCFQAKNACPLRAGATLCTACLPGTMSKDMATNCTFQPTLDIFQRIDGLFCRSGRKEWREELVKKGFSMNSPQKLSLLSPPWHGPLPPALPIEGWSTISNAVEYTAYVRIPPLFKLLPSSSLSSFVHLSQH
jgi:hypothetical protein